MEDDEEPKADKKLVTAKLPRSLVQMAKEIADREDPKERKTIAEVVTECALASLQKRHKKLKPLGV